MMMGSFWFLKRLLSFKALHLVCGTCVTLCCGFVLRVGAGALKRALFSAWIRVVLYCAGVVCVF